MSKPKIGFVEVGIMGSHMSTSPIGVADEPGIITDTAGNLNVSQPGHGVCHDRAKVHVSGR